MNVQRANLMHFQVLAILVISALGSGCAIMISGTTDKISIDSRPQGADIYINDAFQGKTPLVVEVKKREAADALFRIEHEECQSIEFNLEKYVDPWSSFAVIIDAALLFPAFFDLYYQPSLSFYPGEFHIPLIKKVTHDDFLASNERATMDITRTEPQKSHSDSTPNTMKGISTTPSLTPVNQALTENGKADTAARLQSLNALHAEGVVSPEEYARKRADIIDSL